MTRQWINSRAADVRGAWTLSERRQRAEVGEQRRRELLAQLGLGGNVQRQQWAKTRVVGDTRLEPRR